MREYIFGNNAILEAIKMGMPIKKVFLSPTLKDFAKLSETFVRLAPEIEIEQLSRRKMESLAGGIRTGGICAVLQDSEPLKSVDTLVAAIKQKTETPLIAALDEIQDPHNFGAIIRSALGAGFHGIVYQKRRQAGITGVVAATSAGACFRIPLCQVVNLSRTLSRLKRLGFWIYGTDKEEGVSLYDVSFNAPLALVIGSEGKGMRRLVRSTCDEIVSIQLHSQLDSLNASVAAGIIMFEIIRQVA